MRRQILSDLLIPLVLYLNLGFTLATATENSTSLVILNTTVISSTNDTSLRDNDGVISSESDAVLTSDVSHLQHGGLTQSWASNSTSRTAGSFYNPITTKAREDKCDGYACGEDEFCSRPWQRCRACEEIKSRCQDLGDVHSNVPACEAFCVRLQKEEADRVCTAEKLVYQQEVNQLQQSLIQTDSALNKTQTEASADRTRCTGEQEESRQKLADQDNLIKVLDRNLTEARNETAKCREDLGVSREKYNGLEGELVALRIILGLVLLGAVVAIGVLVRKCQMLQRRSTNTGDQRRLIQVTTTEGDQRLNINHDFGDKLLPGGARTPIFLRPEQRHNIALA